MVKQHVIVYQEPGRYAGWPANYGIWSWGDEMVVAYTVGYPSPQGGFHARDRSQPFVTVQSRSLDGGRTWAPEPCPIRSPGGRGVSADEHMVPELHVAQALSNQMPVMPVDCHGGIDFAHPDLAILCARTGLGAGTSAWWYVSTDRCHSFQGPYWLPRFGQPGVEARTDYIVSGRDTCTFFLTATRTTGGEGGGVFCTRTEDGGRTIRWVSWVAKSSQGYVIMPSTVRLDDRRMITAVRCRGSGDTADAPCWIDLYGSDDNGETWRILSRPAPVTGRGGNPPSMIRLQDGRLCLTYGYRAPAFGIRARLSDDDGRNWGEEIVLRDDGGSHDLGYPRTTQRPDGTIVTAYYFNDQPGGETYIAATLWRP